MYSTMDRNDTTITIPEVEILGIYGLHLRVF